MRSSTAKETSAAASCIIAARSKEPSQWPTTGPADIPPQNSTGYVTERLGASLKSGQLDGPRRAARIEAGLAESLENSADERSGESKRQQIGATGGGTAQQSGKKGNLPASAVCQRSREESAAERYEGENPDNETNGLIGPAEVMPHMRGKSREHRANAQKPQKGCAD
jgi:hypothetical protein